MTAGLEFGINELVVDGDLVPASLGGEERDGLDLRFEVLEQVICQAHGPVGVVSDCTICDGDLQHGWISLGENYTSS